MTDNQILQLASQYLTRGLHTDTGWNDIPEWTVDTENLLVFARTIYEAGVLDGQR